MTRKTRRKSGNLFIHVESPSALEKMNMEDRIQQLKSENEALRAEGKALLAENKKLLQETINQSHTLVELQEESHRLKAELETSITYPELVKDRDAWKYLAERLGEALKDVLNHGLLYENGETHVADVDKAKEALAEYEKMQGEKR